MQYTPVKRAHILPRFWLEHFAGGKKIGVHIVENGKERTLSVEDVAIRRTFYRRTRPDGTSIDDIEWSLSQLEGAIAPLLGQIETQWPLGQQMKGNIAEFLAFQAVRGPRWREWHEEFVTKAIEELQQERVHQMESGIWVPLSQEIIDAHEEFLRSDTQRLTRMMSVANKLIYIFGSMTWDLIKFDEPLLALSDHPVVEWPLEEGRRLPGVAVGHGASNVLEARVPIAPDLALLMTWADQPDSSDLLPGAPEVAENMNAFTIAQAEKQWMWRPDSSPQSGEGPFDPLSLLLRPGYERGAAERSAVRAKVKELLTPQLGELDPSMSAQLVSVNPSPPLP